MKKAYSFSLIDGIKNEWCKFKSFITEKLMPQDKAYYNRFDNDFICSDCASSVSDSAVPGTSSDSQFIPLKIQAVQYLSATSLLTPAESRKIPLDEASFVQIKNFIFYLIENNIESKLYSIETGKGILWGENDEGLE